MDDNELGKEISEEEEYEAEDADYLQEQEFADEYDDKQHESTAPSSGKQALEDEDKELLAVLKRKKKEALKKIVVQPPKPKKKIKAKKKR